MSDRSICRLKLSDAEQKLEADSGELILLTGDVGCGKSVWLKRLAGMIANPEMIHISMNESKPKIRMLFDRWPCLWLGQTIEEELIFGLKEHVSTAQLADTLLAWGLGDLHLCSEPHALNRLQSIRLAFAAMTLAKPDLILLDNPSAALSEDMAMNLSSDIASWLHQSNTIVVVASNRWHDWRSVATQRWNVSTPNALPELINN